MRCERKISLRGGFIYEIRKAMYLYICFYCLKPIYRKAYYVLERDLSGTARRYHPECLEKMMSGRIKIRYVYERETKPLLCTD